MFRWPIQSAVEGLRWPGLPAPRDRATLVLLFQLEQTQWLPPEELRARQLRQLEGLLRHAYRAVPFYRQHWKGAYDPAAPLTEERFAALPLLQRKHVQQNFDALTSRHLPKAHGESRMARTSGSSGTPLRVRKSGLTALVWRANVLRDHLWHGRDLSGKLAVIRAGARRAMARDWGHVTRGLVETGPGFTLGVDVGADETLRVLERQQPSCLQTYPSLLRELILRSGGRKDRLPKLREVCTMGELLGAEVRELCRDAWGITITDTYSAEEVGYVALQCPRHPHYHFMAESARVEILDGNGKPCPPGAVGRLAVTSLHNFAMPLVRYDIRDYAEAGAACDCGRGLPVATRILGRVNNMLVTADGNRYWPMFGMRTLKDVEVRQHQFVQKAFDLVEARLVTAGPVSEKLKEKMARHMASHLPHGVRVEIVLVSEIPRSAGGKFQDFISEVAPR
jgi:phenylacetate-CoA ligase